MGLRFFLAGVFLAVHAVGLARIENTSEWKRLELGLVSSVFLAVGGTLVFGRRWLILDTGRRFLIRQYGLLIPMTKRERSLGDFKCGCYRLRIGFRFTRPIPVRLKATRGKDIVISSPEQFGGTRNQAEFLSRFLQLPLADTTTDHELIVSPERSSETLQERLHYGQAQNRGTPRPSTLRCKIDESGGHLTITIPGRMSLTAAVFSTFLPCIVILIVVPALWGLFSRTGTPMGMRFAFLAFVVLVFGILPLVGAIKLAGIAKINRTVVRASKEGLVIERRGVWRTQTIRVSAADILDLACRTFDGILESAKRSATVAHITPHGGGESRLVTRLKEWVWTKGIIVKSRQGLTTFGEGLSAEELRFLKSVLTDMLVG